jgi:hypothetical protein
MATYFEINTTTNEIIAQYTVLNAECVKLKDGCELVEVPVSDVLLYRVTPVDKKALWENGSVLYV